MTAGLDVATGSADEIADHAEVAENSLRNVCDIPAAADSHRYHDETPRYEAGVISGCGALRLEADPAARRQRLARQDREVRTAAIS